MFVVRWDNYFKEVRLGLSATVLTVANIHWMRWALQDDVESCSPSSGNWPVRSFTGFQSMENCSKLEAFYGEFYRHSVQSFGPNLVPCDFIDIVKHPGEKLKPAEGKASFKPMTRKRT